MHTSFVKL